MGSHLVVPNREKTIEPVYDGDDAQDELDELENQMKLSEDKHFVKWSAFSMQGWRKTQEDYHLVKYDEDKQVSLFGVFDGHGGRQVSEFLKDNFWEELTSNANYRGRKYELALKETFVRMDAKLIEDQNRREQALKDALLDAKYWEKRKLPVPKKREDMKEQEKKTEKWYWNIKDVGSTCSVVLVTRD